MWDAITTVIRMNDKVERMAETMKSQQQKIEQLNERLLRLEMAVQFGMGQQHRPDVRVIAVDAGVAPPPDGAQH
jgi:hypothetical protein